MDSRSPLLTARRGRLAGMTLKGMTYLKNNRGVALILALVVFGVAGVLAVSLSAIVSHQARLELRQADGTALFYGADAGIEMARYHVKNTSSWLESYPAISPIINEAIGDTSVTVTVTGPVDDFYTVTSTARWLNSSLTRTVRIKAKSPASASMSKYMFFVNNAHLNIGSGAEVWGEVHSNLNIKIFGGGVIFHDEVTASNKVLFYAGATPANTTFLATPAPGYWEDAPPVAMPDISAFDSLKTYAIADNCYYTNNTSIELFDSGLVSINGGAPVGLPANGVIFCEKDINISGTLDGKLTVASMQTINITDNLLYADPYPYDTDPDTITDPPLDLLGLIANNHIYIPNSAPHNLEINAAMIARTGKAYCGLSTTKGQLIIHGSLCTSQLSYFASTSGHGYSDRDYYYDPSLKKYTPPHYLTIYEEESFKDWRDEGE